MSCAAGPNTIKNGLVFSFDMNNTKKSWKGEPQNIAPKSDYSNRTYDTLYTAASWGGDAGEVYYYSSGGYNNLPYKKLIKTVAGTGGSYLDDHDNFTLEEGKTYRVSCWMKADRSVTLNGYALSVNRKVDNLYIIGGSPSLTVNWSLVTFDFTCATGQGGIYWARQIIYVDDILPTTIYWSDFSVKNISNISDLMNNSVPISKNLTYNVDGTFKFDGVDDYVTTSISCNKTYYSINWWMNPAAVTNYNNTFGFNTGNVQTWGAFLFHTTSTGGVYVGTTGADANRMTPTNLPAGTLATNTWQNFCWTFDNGTAKFYKNGILLATKVLPVSVSEFTSFTLGTTGSTTINGSISNLSIYSNKVLSSDEIKQNFNAIRSRYGI